MSPLCRASSSFASIPQVLLDTLTEFVPDHVATMRVIAYVRPHANRLVSAFMQRTKAGLFQGDMEAFFVRTQAENLLHYAPRFQNWRAVFGDRFTLRPMIREELRDGDVVKDFLHLALNDAPFTLQQATEANTSLPLEFVVGLREAQAVLKRNEVPVGTRHSVGDYINRSLARSHPGVGTKLRMNRKLYEDIKVYCKGDADTLDTEFFGKPIMANALEAAASDTVDSDQNMLTRSYYTEEAIKTLRGKARQAAMMFKRRPAAWNIAFEREIGQRAATDAEMPMPMQVYVDKVNALLTDIATIIAAPGISSDV